ncbi:hypothetical protein MA16_Dca008142 [Dendrobium catenatum]|uniref:Uncharacterized protein n=1 Tax=Dendrobium catenatum TaxID=906689 RepID=A0A2I0X9Z5_9ASPA|nr:hypothetical protein MA16_Dca008142 [Dendrobium catenatum]
MTRLPALPVSFCPHASTRCPIVPRVTCDPAAVALPRAVVRQMPVPHDSRLPRSNHARGTAPLDPLRVTYKFAPLKIKAISVLEVSVLIGLGLVGVLDFVLSLFWWWAIVDVVVLRPDFYCLIGVSVNDVVVGPNVLGAENVVVVPCGELVVNPPVDMNLEPIQDGNMMLDVGTKGVAEILMSPIAIPFFPSCVPTGQTAELGGSPIVALVTDVNERLNSIPIGVVSTPVVDVGLLQGDPSVLGIVEGSDKCQSSIRKVQSSVGGQVDISNVQGSLINVPVKLLASQTMVGSKSGMDVRSHGDWLKNSSDIGSESDSFSDPGSDFEMVPERHLRAGLRGKLWKRGGRKR